MSEKLQVFLILMPIFVGSMALHELGHAWVASRLGDPTAKQLGRITLNPIKHLDPLGTAMFAITYWSSSFLFGWAKPVPVDPRNLRVGPQIGMALVGAAGPIVNFALALVSGALLAHVNFTGTALRVAYTAVIVNVVLGVFNLIPIPPLDGSRIIGGFMPRELYLKWSSFDQYGFYALIALLFLARDTTTTILTDVNHAVLDLISAIVGGTPLY